MAQGRALMSSMVAVAGGKAAAAVAGLLTIMVLTRHLGPHDFGYYRTVLTYSAFAAVLADLGIYLVGLREMSQPGADVSRVVGTAFLLRLASTALVLLVTSLFAQLLPYDPVVKRGIFLAALIYIGFQANEFLNGIFQRVMKQGGSAIAEATGAVATLGVVWLLARADVGVVGMLCGTLFGAAVALAVSWTLAHRLIPFSLHFDAALWRRYLTAAMPIAGSQILTMAMLRGDTLLLSLLKPAAHVGLYGVPTKMFELATSLPYLFAGLMMPSLTAAGAEKSAAGAAKGADGSFSRTLGRSLDAMLMYGVGVILALSIFAPQILTLISGARFAAGAPALAILAFAVTLTAMSFVLRFALIALDRSRFVLIADAVACAIALAAYLVLIPRFSFVGAAAGTAIAEGSILIGMLWGIRRAGQPLPRCHLAPRTLLAGVVAAACIFALARWSAPWLLALVIGGGVYLGLLALLGAIPREITAGLLRRPFAGDGMRPAGTAPAPALHPNTSRRRAPAARIAIVSTPQDDIVAGDEQRGAVAIVSWELAKRLAKRFEVVVYAPLRKGQPRTERWNSLEIRRIPCVTAQAHRAIQLVCGRLRTPRPYFDTKLYYREYFTGLARDLRGHPADIVHIPQALQFAPVIRAAAPAARVVLHMHQDELALLPEYPLRRRLENVDAVVTASDWVTRRAAERFPALASPIRTIWNGVDIERFHPAAARPEPASPPRLLCIGRIAPEQGVHVLIAAFERLVRERPDAQLDVVGKADMLPRDMLSLLLRSDPEPGALGELYGRSRLQAVLSAVRGRRRRYFDSLTSRSSGAAAGRVRFHGTVDSSELLQLYQHAHLLVLPSLWNESCCTSVAEAMACGVPVVASQCSGVSGLVEPGISGLLVPRGDVEALLDVLRRLLADRETLSGMGRAARRRAELLTWDRSAERLGRVYDSLLENCPEALSARRAEHATSAYG